ncbi:MAG TPA: ATP-binding cassette domain-containing protein [Streptosporangiaceae bacterium]|jgi:phospholipid/cholesterol/gamma-HCH transport system ATP-binding protein|nr:ATP-binding cassette domain-containing protein [Streptosporangiaceae bacterium]
MGIEVVVESLTKTFGRRAVWRDVTLSLPPGEVSVMLGPSGTGKTVFLKSLIGLIKPDRGRVLVDGVDTAHCSERELFQVRKKFGVLFQDGALFGSMNLFDNIAFPLREHTKKTEAEIRRIVLERMDMVGLAGEERKLPGEISGGMRKRAGLARALVMDPQIILCDEPDSGLDPVRTTYLSQLLIDLNAQIDATILIVTHNIQVARTVPDNMGMLFRGDLVMFGPREVLLTSEVPAVAQFLDGSRIGPIGMSEEKDEATMAMEQAQVDAGHHGGGSGLDLRVVVPQLEPTPGLPPRQAVQRRKDRVMSMLHTLPPLAQKAILDSLTPADRERYRLRPGGDQPGPTPPGSWGTERPAAQTRPMMPADGTGQAPYSPNPQTPHGQHRYNPDPPPGTGRGGRP